MSTTQFTRALAIALLFSLATLILAACGGSSTPASAPTRTLEPTATLVPTRTSEPTETIAPTRTPDMTQAVAEFNAQLNIPTATSTLLPDDGAHIFTGGMIAKSKSALDNFTQARFGWQFQTVSRRDKYCNDQFKQLSRFYGYFGTGQVEINIFAPNVGEVYEGAVLWAVGSQEALPILVIAEIKNKNCYYATNIKNPTGNTREYYEFLFPSR